MNGAVFLDRDGTIIEEVNFLKRLSDLQIFNNTPLAISLLNKIGLKVIVITNQSGVARGFFNEEFVHKTHKKIENQLKEKGAKIDAWYFCPHHPSEGQAPYKRLCKCRKPGVALVERAKKDFNIDLFKSFIIGDSLRDLETGWNLHLKTILVLTGYGKKTLDNLTKGQKEKINYVGIDILDAAKWILNSLKKGPLKES